jgi:hypothetical protein
MDVSFFPGATKTDIAWCRHNRRSAAGTPETMTTRLSLDAKSTGTNKNHEKCDEMAEKRDEMVTGAVFGRKKRG